MLEKLIDNEETEYRRIKSLSKFDLDYDELQNEFKSLVELAAMISGAEMSVINLIDNYYQWTVTTFSSKLLQMPREESICNRTIQSHDPLEISDLDKDELYKDRGFSEGDGGFNYYLGFPLTLASGDNIGALCILDKEAKEISEKDKAMLRIIVAEIVNKLEARKKLDESLASLNEAIRIKNQVAHDVRGPINGIASLAELAESEESSEEEKTQYFQLIKESGKSIIELTDDILKRRSSVDDGVALPYMNLQQLKVKLLKLYRLPSRSKKIDFQIKLNPERAAYNFPKRKLLSIFGNLISNAIKFTPANGEINISMDILNLDSGRFLQFVIIDNGIGMSESVLEDFRGNTLRSTAGTSGEEGFGLGLKLVRDMVYELNGDMNISSAENQGTKIEVKLLLN